jgi:hypothetical protein
MTSSDVTSLPRFTEIDQFTQMLLKGNTQDNDMDMNAHAYIIQLLIVLC